MLHTQCMGAEYAKILSAAPVVAPPPLDSKGKKKPSRDVAAPAAAKPSRDVAAPAAAKPSRDVAAPAAPCLEDAINLPLEFDCAVKSLKAAVSECAWSWTLQTLLPFLKSSIDCAARAVSHVVPVVSHKLMGSRFIDAMHGLQATLNGINTLSVDAKTKETLSKHTLKCLGGNVLNILVQALADPVLLSALCPSGTSMTAEIRTKLLSQSSSDEKEKREVEAANRCAASPRHVLLLQSTGIVCFCALSMFAGLLRRASPLTRWRLLKKLPSAWSSCANRSKQERSAPCSPRRRKSCSGS